MMDRFLMAIAFPLLAVLIVAVYAGGLGVLFMVLHETPLHAGAVIILGLALVIGVPTAAALLQRALEKR